MGIRGVIRDLLILILGYKILQSYITNQQINYSIITITIVLILLSLWFFAERIGVLPK